MKFVPLHLLISLLFYPLHGQEVNYVSSGYYSRAYLADSLFLIKDYQGSYEVLNTLFEETEPLDFSPYYEYRTYVKAACLLGETEQASKGLQDLISNYGLQWTSIQTDPVLLSIAKEMKLTREWHSKLSTNYLSHTDPKIGEKLKQMALLDQKYRSKGEYFTNRDKQDAIDAANKKEFLKIIDEIGYPTFRKLGLIPDAHFNEMTILTILLHTDSRTRQEILLPKIKRLVEVGDCNPEVYGYLYDQMQVYGKKPQKYGSYFGDENLDSLHFHRRSIGLPHYSYKQWRFKAL